MFEPDAPFRHVEVVEHGGRRKLAKQALRGFVGIRRERRDIDERGYPRIGPCVRDQCSAIGMTDEDRRAGDPGKARLHGGDVGREGIEAMLAGHHLMALGLERWDQLTEARSIGPKAMRENDAWFCHDSLRWLREP